MKALVTGGAGFVGTNLIKALLEKKYTIVSIDNYKTGTQLNHQPGVRYVDFDIRHITDYLIFPIDVLTKDPKFKKHINPHNNKWNDITIKGKKHITHYCVSMDEYNIICTKIPQFQTIKDKATIHRGTRLEGSHGSKKAFDNLEFYIE
jgi:dTDP-D-glucose 4,6-dehydratase